MQQPPQYPNQQPPQQPPSAYWQPPQQNYGPPQSPYTDYQQPQFPPPQRPKPPTASQSIMKFIALLRKKPILIIPVALVVVIIGAVIITAGVQGVQQSQQQTEASTATADAQSTACCAAPTSAPTNVPTQAPQATTAPVPALLPATHGTPLLGSLMSDFVGKFGQPNDHSTAGQIYHFLRVPGSNIDGLIVAFYPGTQQAGDITVATSDPGWTVSEAQARCFAYMPADAHFKQKFPYADNTGFDMVYTSASLARMFPASDFSDGNSNQVAPGTFDVSYLYATDNQHIGDCDMIIGEQQTNL